MTATQIQGLWICLTLSLSFVALMPALVWVLPSRKRTA